MMPQKHARNPDFLSIDSDVLSMLLDGLSSSEIKAVIDSIAGIEDNIFDVFNGMLVPEIIKSQKIDLQTIFDQMEVVLPKYSQLLKDSINKFGDEMYLDSAEIEISMKQKGYFPKLLISDGSRAFALMQVAACHAGVDDEYLRLWYVFTSMFLQSIYAEQQVAH